MARLSLNLNPSLGLTQQNRLVHRLKLAKLLSLSEPSFNDLVHQVEKDPLFLQYKAGLSAKDTLFSYKRFPRSSVSVGFLGLNEEIASGRPSTQVEHLFEGKEDVLKVAQKIGIENFKEYFLHNENGLSIDEISKLCGFEKEAVQKVMDVVDQMAVEEEFQQTPEKQPSSAQSHFSKIATIEKDASGEFVVHYTSLRYGRGRYVIDYEKFKSLKNQTGISKEDIQSLQMLIKTMELINTRKSMIYQTLEKITERQLSFLKTQDAGQLNSMTQLELARELDIHSSSISRAIFGKSIGMPWGEEIPLKFFFVKGPVNKIKSAIYTLIEEEEKKIRNGSLTLPYRDEEIKNLLKVERDLTVAVRTINKYRSELGIPNVYQRATSYKEKDPLKPSLS